MLGWLELVSVAAAASTAVACVLVGQVYWNRVHNRVVEFDEERLDRERAELVLTRSAKAAEADDTLSQSDVSQRQRQESIIGRTLTPNAPIRTDIVVSTTEDETAERFFAADEMRAVEAVLRICPGIAPPDRVTDALHDAASYDVISNVANLLLFGSPLTNPATAAIIESESWRQSMGCEFLRQSVAASSEHPTTVIRFDGTVYTSRYREELARFRAGRYSSGLEDFGMVARTRHPVHDSAALFIFAGICALGTLGAAQFISEQSSRLVDAVGDDDFAILINCFRRDPHARETTVEAVHAHRVIDGIAEDIDVAVFVSGAKPGSSVREAS
jgi:hypothetical protein